MTWLKHNWLVAVSFAVMLIAAMVGWFNLEGPLPVHWGLNGEPDRYGTKLEALGLIPLIVLISYTSKIFLPKLDKEQKKNAHVLSSLAKVLVVGMSVIYVGTVASYLGVNISTGNVVALGAGIVLVGFGNLMPKVAPSHWIGVRVPWVYKSKKTWYKTQRLGGWVYTLNGVLFILIGLFSSNSTTLLAGAVLLLLSCAAGLTFYSYWIWRNDDDPQPTFE